MVGYYDFVLAVIPLSLFGITGTLTTAGLDLASAVPLAATVAVLVIGHALFVNGPVDTPPRSVDQATHSAPSVGPIDAD